MSSERHQKPAAPLKRGRLQKKSSLHMASQYNLNQAKASTDSSTSKDSLKHFEREVRMGQIQRPRVEIVSSMSNAGLPGPGHIPAVYRHDPKLALNLPEETSSLYPSRAGHSRSATLPSNFAPRRSASFTSSTARLPPLDYCLDRTSLQMSQTSPSLHGQRSFQMKPKALSVRWQPTISTEIPEATRPATRRGPTSPGSIRSSADVDFVNNARSLRGYSGRFTERSGRMTLDGVQEEEATPSLSGGSRSSASSCYSRTSSLSDNGLDHVGRALKPVIDQTMVYPTLSPFEADKFADEKEPRSFLNLERSHDSLLELYERQLSVIESEPESRDSIEEKGLKDEHKDKATTLARPTSGLAIVTPSSYPTMDQAREQLEAQLQAVSARISNNQEADERSPVSSQSSTLDSPGSRSSVAISLNTLPTELNSPEEIKPAYFPSLRPSASASVLCLVSEPEEGQDQRQSSQEAVGDASIDSSAASEIIYHILSALPDLASLFSAALISRGFYSVFKRHELDLIKGTIRHVSPAAWDLCESTPPKDGTTGLDDASLPHETPSSYLRRYDRAMYTVVALKAIIVERCQQTLKPGTMKRFYCNDNKERSNRLDRAFWRIWTFCHVFGCNSDHERNINTQKAWLDGDHLTRRYLEKTNQLVCGLKDSKKAQLPLDSVSAANDVRSGQGLSRRDLEDMLEAWNSMYALLQSLNIDIFDANKVGLFGTTISTTQHHSSLLQEWFYYVLSLGPRVVLDLASTWPSSSRAIMQKAKNKGWTRWTIPLKGASRSGFLYEAITRLLVEKVLAETRGMSITLPKRARPFLHKHAKSEPKARPQAADLIFPSRSLTSAAPRPASQRSVVPQRRYGMLGPITIEPPTKPSSSTEELKSPKAQTSSTPLSRKPDPSSPMTNSSSSTHSRSHSDQSTASSGSLRRNLIHPALRHRRTTSSIASIDSSIPGSPILAPMITYGNDKYALPYTDTRESSPPRLRSPISSSSSGKGAVKEYARKDNSMNIQVARAVDVRDSNQKARVTVQEIRRGGYCGFTSIGQFVV